MLSGDESLLLMLRADCSLFALKPARSSRLLPSFGGHGFAFPTHTRHAERRVVTTRNPPHHSHGLRNEVIAGSERAQKCASLRRLANVVSATNWRRVKRSFCCVTPYACTRNPRA